MKNHLLWIHIEDAGCLLVVFQGFLVLSGLLNILFEIALLGFFRFKSLYDFDQVDLLLFVLPDLKVL